MKKRNLYFIPLVLSIAFGFNSCNIGEGGNITNFPPAPAVVYTMDNMGSRTIIGTLWGGYVAVPSMQINAYPGDCLIMGFTIDYDNQPSTDYLTATNIQVTENVEYSSLEGSTSVEMGDYTLPISGVSGATSEFLNGKFFTLASCKDKNPSFRLVYNTEEEETGGVKNFYLLARPSSSTPNSTDVSTFYAFDMSNFIYYQGRDTVISVSGSSDKLTYKYIRANLKYFSNFSETDQPVFANVNNPGSPVEILIPIPSN